MNRRDTGGTTGFTIIEVMFFFAISTAITVGVLATASIAVNQQRYKDGLNSLQTVVQQQYNKTAHVVNERSSNSSCDAGGVNDIGVAEARGTSECVIMGRYITISGGTDMVISNVIGFGTLPASVTNDIDALKAYTLFTTSLNSDVSKVPWSAKVVPSNISILILRSPLTGSLRTFTKEGAVANFGSLVDQANMTGKKICLDPDDVTVTNHLGIMVAAGATGPSGITILGDGQC